MHRHSKITQSIQDNKGFKGLFQLLIFAVCSLYGTNALASSASEASAGALLGLFSPTYGKFGTLTTDKTEPALPKYVLLTGGQALFEKKNFIAGGRVLVGSSKSQKVNSGSYYDTSSMGFLVGYGLNASFMDLSLMSMLGMGKIIYSSATDTATNNTIIEASFLAIEPTVLLGIFLSNNFKISVGGTYQLALFYRVDQYGIESLTSPSTEVKGGGTTILFNFAFGSFSGG